MKISVVIPIYGSKCFLNELNERILDALECLPLDYEVIYVVDDCPQGSWEHVSSIASKNTKIIGLNLSKNFGQHYAISAGLKYSSGDWVVVMDGDLQDQPEEISKLYQKATEGYDIVFAQRKKRRDSFIKTNLSKVFYATLEYFTDSKHDSTVANFGIYSRQVINAVLSYGERNRLFPLLVRDVGFNKASIEIEHAARKEGKSSYTFKKLINLAVDTIIAHSNKPLRLSIKFGFFISFSSFLYSIYLFVSYFFYDVVVAGWTSVMVSMFFLFGLTFSMFGITGLYLGKVFDEVKNRPVYIVKDAINLRIKK